MNLNADNTTLTIAANTTVDVDAGLYRISLQLIDTSSVLSDELAILLRVGETATGETEEDDTDGDAEVLDVGAKYALLIQQRIEELARQRAEQA